jgi:hypothetical protein
VSFLAGLPCLQVVVEGQANAVPISSVAAPVISNATFATAGVTVASTTGGTLLALSGVHFGPSVNYTQVTIRVPAGDFPTTNCSLTTPDTGLQCVLPVASGAISRVIVSVLGQSSAFVPAGLAYAPPVITGATPSTLPTTGATITITGTSFGNMLGNLVLLVNGVPSAVTMPVRT